MILPVRGAGLWGPMHGFLALQQDLNTVAGLGFFEHKETPGLGGEVDNPRWKSPLARKAGVPAGWRPGHRSYQGRCRSQRPQICDYQVDGLSGATLTARGVTNLVRFWLGDNGLRPVPR